VNKTTKTLNWRSGLVMTAGVTCAVCFRAGDRGEGSRVMTVDEMRAAGGYSSPRYNAARRNAFRRHLKAQHPELLAVYFGKTVPQ
jgi:hypothetical protein